MILSQLSKYLKVLYLWQHLGGIFSWHVWKLQLKALTQNPPFSKHGVQLLLFLSWQELPKGALNSCNVSIKFFGSMMLSQQIARAWGHSEAYVRSSSHLWSLGSDLHRQRILRDRILWDACFQSFNTYTGHVGHVTSEMVCAMSFSCLQLHGRRFRKHSIWSTLR